MRNFYELKFSPPLIATDFKLHLCTRRFCSYEDALKWAEERRLVSFSIISYMVNSSHRIVALAENFSPSLYDSLED